MSEHELTFVRPRERPAKARLRITTEGLHGKTGRLWLNDEEITHQVHRVEVVFDCHDATRAVVHLLVEELEVDGQVLASVAPGGLRIFEKLDRCEWCGAHLIGNREPVDVSSDYQGHHWMPGGPHVCRGRGDLDPES